MANDITSERLYICDTAAVLVADGTPVIVRKIVFFPAAASNEVTIQEYSNAAALRTAIHIKAGPSDASAVTLDFGTSGRLLNGMKLSAITAGQIDIYIGKN